MSAHEQPEPAHVRGAAEGDPAPVSEAAPDSGSGEFEAASGLRWRKNALLFGLTCTSVFYTGYSFGANLTFRERIAEGAAFALSLLGILVVHEFGHYAAARYHRVEASLPFFLPLPLLSPFGTMGAVIKMSGKIRGRNALLDIGASGPLAGLCVAIPLYAWAVRHSTPVPLQAENVTQLGNSLLLRALDGLFAPQVGPGMDIQLSSAAYGAWGGLFITMLNLLPLGQLDGGHVAFALFGGRQNRFAPLLHRSLLGIFALSLLVRMVADWRAGAGFSQFGRNLNASQFWLFWFEMLAILGSFTQADPIRLADPAQVARESVPDLSRRHRIAITLALILAASFGRDVQACWFWALWLLGLFFLLVLERRGGVLRAHCLFDHPATEPGSLSPVRQVIALVTLALFVLLLMPTPMST